MSRNLQETQDGTPVGTRYNLQLRGTILPYMGSPTSSGTFWTDSNEPPAEQVDYDARLEIILKKQAALKQLFGSNGYLLEIEPLNGLNVVRCTPEIKNIEFAEGNWFERCNYVVNAECDKFWGTGDYLDNNWGDITNYYLSQASEDWNIEASDDHLRTYRLTHSISATGKRTYDGSGNVLQYGWQNARDWVLTKLGVDSDRLASAGVLDATHQAYNHVRGESCNENAGTFQVTETWLCYDATDGIPAVEDFTVNLRTTENGITRASIDGTITGLSVDSNYTIVSGSGQYDNAKAKWLTIFPGLKTRCEGYAQAFPMSGSGLTPFSSTSVTLHPVPLSSQVGINENNGIITYQFEFDDRASTSVSGAISELVSVEDDLGGDIFAIVPVLGRAVGPVLQDLQASGVTRRTVTIEIQMPASRQDYTPAKPDTSALLSTLIPAGSQVFVGPDRENWIARQGRYLRNTTYTYQ